MIHLLRDCLFHGPIQCSFSRHFLALINLIFCSFGFAFLVFAHHHSHSPTQLTYPLHPAPHALAQRAGSFDEKMIDALMSTIDQCAAYDPSGEITRRLIAGGAAKTILEALRCAPQVTRGCAVSDCVKSCWAIMATNQVVKCVFNHLSFFN